MDSIRYDICVALLGPIAPQDYVVGDAIVNVSYPEALRVGDQVIQLPRNRSTLFSVSWNDTAGSVGAKLRQEASAERFQPLTTALDYVNRLILAFKLVRIGHADGVGLRTIGEADTLFYCSFLNGVQTNQFNMHLRVGGSIDTHGTTPRAIPHINSTDNATGRRFVRCFELLEHGYFTETLVVAFAILDDAVQLMLQRLLEQKGMTATRARELIRAIKADRLKVFLGPLLKVLSGHSITEVWSDADEALSWFNRERNRAMHGGYVATRRTAALALFASMKTLVTLWKHEGATIELPVEMFRHAKLTAAWEDSPPAWVPKGAVAEAFDFD